MVRGAPTVLTCFLSLPANGVSTGGGGPEGPRIIPWLQAGTRFSAIGAPLLVTLVSVSGYYVLLVDRCFWALGGVDTVTLLGTT